MKLQNWYDLQAFSFFSTILAVEEDNRRRVGDTGSTNVKRSWAPTFLSSLFPPESAWIPTSETHTDLSAGTRGWNFHWSSSGSKVSLFMILFFSSGGMKFSMIRYLQVHNTRQCKGLVWGRIRNKYSERIESADYYGVWIVCTFSLFLYV